MSINIRSELAKNITHSTQDYLETKLFCAELDSDVTVTIYFSGLPEITERHVAIITAFVGTSELQKKLAEALHEHAVNSESSVSHQVANPDDAWSQATLNSLIIFEIEHWIGMDGCMLIFEVDWDEHGAGVICRNGDVESSCVQ